MPSFGKKSLSNYETLDIKLQLICDEVIKHYDFTILEGHRTRETHEEYLAKKRTRVPYSRTKHRHNPSQAMDVAPWPIPHKWGDVEWKDRVHFYELAALIKYEAKRKGIGIRWGGDWDSDNDYKDQTFDDLVHFELT